MIELLRDPVWQFVGALLGLFAIAISIILYIKQRTKKELSCFTLSWNPVLSLSEEDQGEIQIFYKNTLVKDVNLIVGKIINTGNIPIISEDYESPIEFNFGEQSNIISAKVVETDPEKMEIKNSFTESSFFIFPLLLNKNDFITVKFLVTKPDPHVSIKSRIVGIHKIKELGTLNKKYFRLSASGILLMLLGILIMAILDPTKRSSVTEIADSWLKIWPGLVIALIGMVISSWGLVKAFPKRYKSDLGNFKIIDFIKWFFS